jgi:predicted NBD/HSP70 family sugar kinase
LEEKIMEIINPKMIGDINKSKIIELIKSCPISRSEIADLLNISRPAVTKNVNALLETGIIREGETDDSLAGRKPLLLEFNNSFGYVMGINIRSKTIQIVLGDLTGRKIDDDKLAIADKNNALTVYKQICKSISSIAERNGMELKDVFTVGISSPGIKDPNTGGHLLNPFIKNWEKINLVDMLKRDLNLECFEFNDVDMSTMGERLSGKGKNCSSFVYIKLWDGFASRYMSNSQIHRGLNNAAGEIGFMLLGEEFLQEGIGTSGKLENMMINSGVADLYKKLSENSITDIDEKSEFGIKEIIGLSKNGDTAAIEVVKKLIKYTAMTIVNITSILDPELIILGGDLVNVDDNYISEMTEIISNNFPFTPRIEKSELGGDSEVIGCISVALEEANKKLQLLW